MRTLGSLELIVLLTVSKLGEDAYGLAVRRAVSDQSGRDYSVGAIYTTLQRLEDKKLVNSHETQPLPVRGGRSRRQFRVTSAGRRAIEDARLRTTLAWQGVVQPPRSRPT
jgi:PadR family transcriptional regulator PadR